jgi:hypothetical protein
MSPTPIGFVVVPVILLIFLTAPQYLLPSAIAVSVLQAASILNVGGAFPIGITPYFFVTILIWVRFVPLWLSGQIGFGSDEHVRFYLHPLLLFVIWGLASAIILPVIFKGALVYTPRAGMDVYQTSPLQWTWSNAAQAGYLLLNCVFVIFVIWKSIDRLQFERCIAAFRWSGAFAAGVGSYQWLSHMTGLPYPQSFFNSNLAWAQLTEQQVGGAWRLSATFTEPSAAGAYFATWTAFNLFSVINHNNKVPWWNWCLLVSGIVMLALTTSTTGYVTLGAMLVLFFGKQILMFLVSDGLGSRALLVILIVIAGIAAGALLLPSFSQVLTEVIWNKSNSSSGQHRMATSLYAFSLVFQTLGLGVGLGSNRPAGLLSYIASNLGVPGLLLFLYLLYVTRALVQEVMSSCISDTDLTSIVSAVGWAFAVEMFAMFAGGAELTVPGIWVLWGILLAACRYGCASTQQSSGNGELLFEPILLLPSMTPIVLVDAVL